MGRYIELLASISLENYKCFKERTDIEIAPLTLLCGVNSSGKSSILKSLLMLKQSAESNLSDGAVVFSGTYVECGLFDDIVYYGCEQGKNEFVLRNRFVINNHKLVNIGMFVKRQDAKVFNELRHIYSSIKGDVKSFIFDVELVIRKCQDDSNEFMRYIKNNEIFSFNIDIHALDTEGEIIPDTQGYLKFELNNNSQSSIDSHFLSWNNIPSFAKGAKSFTKYICSCSFDGLCISNIFAYDMPNRLKAVIPNILSIFRIISNQYKNVEFIAPLRETPQRTYVIKSSDISSVGIHGENTASLLAKIKNRNLITDMYCPWTNELPVDNNGYVKSDYYTIIQQWLDYFEMGHLDVSGDNGIINIRIGQHNISDVGFGLSQVLPIIVQGICMDKEQTLLIEQPEVHLHPKLELQMADFLVALAESERTVIVETHSDHIKNRILRRIVEDNERSLKDKIQIYFIEQTTDEITHNISSVKTSVSIDDCYGTHNSPKGFFDQAAQEQLELLQAGIAKRKRVKDGVLG